MSSDKQRLIDTIIDIVNKGGYFGDLRPKPRKRVGG